MEQEDTMEGVSAPATPVPNATTSIPTLHPTSLVDSMMEEESGGQTAAGEGPVERLWREGAALEARRREVWAALLQWEARRPDLPLFASPEWTSLRPAAPSSTPPAPSGPPLPPQPHPYPHPHQHPHPHSHPHPHPYPHPHHPHQFHPHPPPHHPPPHHEPLHESMTEQMHNVSTAPIAPYHFPAGSAAAPPFPPPIHHHHHMHHHHHGGGRWRRGGGGRGFGPGGGGVGRATTRLARHTKARTLVTELAKLATQPTPEALQGVAAPKQKTRGINKDQVFEVFDSLVNTQLAPQERVTRSSVWKYLFRGSKTSGQVVEPLYGNEKIFKTTKKGGGVRRLTGVMWRDLDTPENRDAVSASLAALEAYSVHIDLEQLKGLIQQELAKDADADTIVDDSPVSPAAADTTTTTTTTTTTASSSSSSDPMGGITHTGVGTAAAAVASPSASATPSSSSSLPYALPTNTTAAAPPPVPQAEALRQPPPQSQPHHMQQEQPYHRDERRSGEQAAAPPDQSSSSSSAQGSNPATAMDSDLQQLLRLLTQKETLEKLQAMVVNK